MLALGELISTVIVIALLGLWLIATVVNAIPGGTRVLRHLGVLAYAIPQWNFFAPNPGVHDYFLLYREQWQGGAIGVWRQAPGFDQDRQWTAAVWNPHKVEKKALFDLVQALAMETRDLGNSIELVKLSVPYLVLLNYVSNLPHSDRSVATQFTVMVRSAVHDTLDPMFVSGLHRLS